ncbi:hypothetical protein L286_17670 [Sphingobium sp. HDIP04]|nr:hypothetical protein L286_17670 [Sphingobium sp. HDIP04]
MLLSAASRPGIVAQNMGAGGRTIRSYAPARCDALGVGRRDDNMIDDLDIERSTKVGKPARRDDVVFARGRVAARVIMDHPTMFVIILIFNDFFE